LDAVKGVGYQAVEAIKRAREEGGEFTSLWDFCERVDSRAVNKKAIEALIKCGALGSTGASRKGMLAVLEQAQGAGQKAQQDAQIGQGSIFDLASEPGDSSAPGATDDAGNADGGVAGAAARPSAGASFLRPSHPPIPAEEYEQAQLLAIEKEAIGLFVSAHPLKPLREILRARTDCPLAALSDRRDKDWVTVGGIIVEAKRIRTRSGDSMMFATLDDLGGAVELLVFGKALSEHENALAVDQVVLVRGRVDHKEAGKTCLIAQTVEVFAPGEQEIEQARKQAETEARTAVTISRPVHARVDAANLSASAIEDIKQLVEDYPGPAEIVLDLDTSSGVRRMRLGEAFRVQNTPTLRAELDSIFAPGPAVAAAVAG
jgi:DNA polymerase-3 subunit alpha